MAQWVEQLPIQLVNRFFFFKNQYFQRTGFLKFSLDITFTWHPKHASKRDLSKIKCTSFGNWIYGDCGWISAFFCSLQCVEGTGVEGRRGTAVITCGTFLSKPRGQTVVNQLSCGFNPHLSQFFFQFMNFLKHVFFQYLQLFELLF